MSDVAEDFTAATPEGEEVWDIDDTTSLPTVPVSVEGIADVRQVGGRESGFRLFNLNSGSPAQRIVDDDPRRAAVTIIPLDQDIRLGHVQGDVGSASAILPVGVPLTLNTSDEIWANAVSGGTNVTVITEYWAR